MIPSVIERWLIAGALEQGRPLPRWLRRRVERSPELARYAATLRTIDSALSSHAPLVSTVPPSWSALRSTRRRPESAPRVPRLNPAWIGGAVALGSLALVVTMVVRESGMDRSSPRQTVQTATLPTVPPSLRQDVIIALWNPVQAPLNQQWRTVTTQTRRSVSDFIRNLPGLPTEDPGPRPQ